MVAIEGTEVVIGGHSWNTEKAGYPSKPTIYAGTTISFGAEACIEHPDPSTAIVTMFLPKKYGDWLPVIGDEVVVRAKFTGDSEDAKVFHGKVDTVSVDDDHVAGPTVWAPVNTHPTLGTALSKTGWTFTGYKTGSLTDITADVTLLEDNFVVPIRSNGTDDNLTITSARFAVTAGRQYKLSFDQFPTHRAFYPPSIEIRFHTASSGGSVVSTRLSTDSIMDEEFTVPAGATHMSWVLLVKPNADIHRGSVVIGGFRIFQVLDTVTLDDPPRYRVRITCSDALAEAGRLRLSSLTAAGELYESPQNRVKKITTLATGSGVNITHLSSSTLVNNRMTSGTVRSMLAANENALQWIQKTVMTAGLTAQSYDNVVQPGYRLLQPSYLGESGGVAFVGEQTSEYSARPLPEIPTSAIENANFQLDTTRVVNAFKLDYHVFTGTAADPQYTAVTELSETLSTGSTFFTPTTRTISTDAMVFNPYGSLEPIRMDNVYYIRTRATAALIAESTPRWRIDGAITVVLKELPYGAGLLDLIEERGRFGQLVKITGTPEFIDEYQRVTGGTIVIGSDRSSLQLELEPADYSGPDALSSDEAQISPDTSGIKFNEIPGTITIGDLRFIGTR